MNRHYGLQQAMQLACPKMKVLIARLNLIDSIFGAKISGSGLGDCLLALGDLPSNTLAEQIPVTIAEQGLIIDE